MWSWALRLGKYALGAWGLTEVATEVTDNVEQSTRSISVSAADAAKAAKNIGITIAVFIGLVLLVGWFLKRKKAGRK
jgi:uncharacterized membrane protein